MLKLEKGRQRNIGIAISSTPRRFNTAFLKALAIASALHLSAIFLFHIHHLFDAQGNILPFTDVETAQELFNEIQVSPENRSTQKYAYRPEPSSPQILAWEGVSSGSIKESDIFYNPFMEAEEPWHDLPKGFSKESQPTTPYVIHVSGSLAEISWTEPLPLERQLMPVLRNPESVVYAVRVEHRTGSVFWRKLAHTPDTQELLPIAERLIQATRFQPPSQVGISSGEIEILFR